jgi:hypothetical protein
MPALGLSLLLVALGAILAFAVDVTVSGLDIQVVGAILMIVGAVGVLASMLFWTSFAPYGNRRSDVVRRDVVRRDVVREHDIA